MIDFDIPANQQKAAEFAIMTIPFSRVVVVPPYNPKIAQEQPQEPQDAIQTDKAKD